MMGMLCCYSIDGGYFVIFKNFFFQLTFGKKINQEKCLLNIYKYVGTLSYMASCHFSVAFHITLQIFKRFLSFYIIQLCAITRNFDYVKVLICKLNMGSLKLLLLTLNEETEISVFDTHF